MVKTKRKILRKTGSKKKEKEKKDEKDEKNEKRRSFLGEARGDRRKRKCEKKDRTRNYRIFAIPYQIYTAVFRSMADSGRETYEDWDY